MPEALINQLADIVGNAGLRTGNDDTASIPD